MIADLSVDARCASDPPLLPGADPCLPAGDLLFPVLFTPAEISLSPSAPLTSWHECHMLSMLSPEGAT